MSSWQPPSQIRAVAIGWAWRGNEVLLVETVESDGNLRGYRPPGGGIEFGEHSAEALKREFLEELGADISIQGPPVILENQYWMNGAKGHEVIFTYPVTILSDHVFAQDSHAITEPDGTVDEVKWLHIDAVLKRDVALLPDGLINHLDQLAH